MPPPNSVIVAFSRAQAWVYARTGGRLWGRYRGRDVLLLSTVGTRSGKRRTTPLVYVEDGDALVVTASNAGRDSDPGWVHNLRADPSAEVMTRGRSGDFSARFAEGAEAEELFARLSAHSPGFNRYKAMTERRFPVVVLTPKGGS